MRKGLLIVGAILASINSFGQEAGELHMRVRATGVVPMEDAKIEAIGGNVAVTNN
ncbi:MAG TPA: OmpW family protein, partial [Flavobacteriaceae bacterium]|nr:OmpW family protein [Flavobacteriaceae bacterium]